jgi:RNA polymerase sigma-70 factor (ECF subfamily)
MASSRPEFSSFFRVHYPSVVRTAYLILGDRGRAEEVAQEAFTQLLVHWRKVSRYERPESWVRRVAIRQAVRTARRDRAREVLHAQTEIGTADRPAEGDLAAAILRLPVRQRTCVLLFYYEDRPITEVAEVLEISTGAVKVHLHRARKALARLLEMEDATP